jgi:hypothetical protein
LTAQDCNDASASTNPGTTEACDGFDNDCDSMLDEEPFCGTVCPFPDVAGYQAALPGNGTAYAAWNGDGYGLAWRVGDEIRFQRVTSNGLPLGVPTTLGMAPGLAMLPKVVWTGSGYGVAWLDDREGTRAVYFARLNQDGVQLGSDLRLGSAYSTLPVALAWGGGRFGVVWSDLRSDNIELYAGIVDGNSGTIVSSDIRLTNALSDSDEPSLVWGEGTFALTWEDNRSLTHTQLYFVGIDVSGAKLFPEVPITENASDHRQPSIAWLGSSLGVTWSDNRDGNYEIYFCRLSPLGVKLTQERRITNNPATSWAPSIAWNGSRVGFSWEDRRLGPSQIYFAEFDTDGNSVSSELRVSQSLAQHEVPLLSWLGTEYGIVHRSGSYNWLSRIACDCQDGDGDGSTSCNDCDDANPAVYPSASQVCDGLNNDCNDAAWPGDFGNEQDHDGDGVTACGGDCNDADPSSAPGGVESCEGNDNDCDGLLDDGASCENSCDAPDRIGEPRRLSAGSPYQMDIAWNGQEFGVVAADLASRTLIFERRNQIGDAIGPPVTVSPYCEDGQFDPNLVWTGQEYGLVWSTACGAGGNRLVFQRLDRFGSSIGGQTSISRSGGMPQVVWNGAGFAFVWYESRVEASGLGVFFAQIGRLGATAVRPQLVSPSTPPPGGCPSLSVDPPAIAWTGSEYGVIWSDSRFSSCGMGSDEIFFRRIGTNGIPVAPEVRLTFDTVRSMSWRNYLAWDGSGFGVVSYIESPGYIGPKFGRIDSVGNRLSPDMPVAPATSIDDALGVTWNGSRFAVSCNAGGASYLALLSASGALIGEPVSLDPGGYVATEPAWTGAQYGAATAGGTSPPAIAIVGCNCFDVDADGYSTCQSDCDDAAVDIHPGAPELCNDVDDNCSGQADEGLSRTLFRDADGDGYGNPALTLDTCHSPTGWVMVSGDCNDAETAVHPGAAEVCNDVDDNCNGTADEGLTRRLYRDADNDGFGDATLFQDTCAIPTGWVAISGDCNDANSGTHPGAVETCNNADDNCNGLVDEDGAGLDSDADGVRNACDNCRFAFNPTQLDSDGDLIGNSCDNCALVSNPSQTDADSDQRGNACDNCVNAYNPFQDDSDLDRVGDACDNCVLDWNATQSDFDHDNQGDRCDENDGLIYVFVTDRDYREWQAESGYATWNSYRGSLAVLRATGQYTQAPGSNPLAARDCGLSDPWVFDDAALAPGEVAFNLVTGIAGGIESGLGTNSVATPRANANPCP